MLERDMLKVFDKTISPNAIECKLNDLHDDFEYLFQTPSFSVHGIG